MIKIGGAVVAGFVIICVLDIANLTQVDGCYHFMTQNQPSLALKSLCLTMIHNSSGWWQMEGSSSAVTCA